MIELIMSSLRLSTPLLFAAMGGILCERSGIATICLEGVMITSAWTAAVVTSATGSPWMGLLAAMAAGAVTMWLHAFLSITAKADQIVSGVAVNLIASGVTPFLNKAIFGSPTNTPSIPMDNRFHPLPLAACAICLPFVLHYIIKNTRPGLRLSAAGDGPTALRAAGVSTVKVRYVALFWGGVVTSFGGTFLSIAHASQFTRDMTAGRGFIALTALIFGKWKPLPTLFACLFFGFTDALQIRLQSTTLAGIELPVQFIQALPYLVTLLILVGFVGRARPPLAIGHPE